METVIEDLIHRITALEGKVARQEKTIRKMKRDAIPESERKVRKPSGFAKPAYLSPELCTFLKVDVGTELARTDVTKLLLAYVKDHNLQNETNRRVINMDDALTKLLKPESDVTYFNIQSLLKIHYVKPSDPPVEAIPEKTQDAKEKKSKKSKK